MGCPRFGDGMSCTAMEHETRGWAASLLPPPLPDGWIQFPCSLGFRLERHKLLCKCFSLI